MPSSQLQLPEGSRYVQGDYIDKNSGKTDLVRRLRNLIKTLHENEVETQSEEWPGLASVAETLLQYLDHSDKQVRLHTVIAAIEILLIYAPDVPWSEDDVLRVFSQMTRQLANLVHTTDPKHAAYQHYTNMLENIAEVRIGCILVDMAAQDENENAQEMLIEFIHVLLHCVHHEHSSKLVEMAHQGISCCVEEYHPTKGVPLPIPILDEILKCIGEGPTKLVLAPQAGPKRSKKSKKLPQIQVSNPSFLIAAAVIRKLVNKMAAPISELLTGLLRREEQVLGRSSIQDDQLYEIIYQLHRVAPSILTTIMGALDLQSPHPQQRYQVTQLLGRLFASHTSFLSSLCYREWLRRSHDVEDDIRLCMVRQCVAIVRATNDAPDAVETLQELVTDGAAEVRLEAIRLITDWAYTTVSPQTTVLLRAVGDRVRSRHKQERQDALVGLAYVYNKRWLVPQLNDIVEEGDACDIELVLNAMHDQTRLPKDDDDEADHATYNWIPAIVFDCGCFTDKVDTGMRSKVLQIIDEVLLKGLTPTAKAVALSIMIETVPESSSNFLWQMMQQRANLQKALHSYLSARSKALEYNRDSEERLVANSRAYELLEAVGALSAPVYGPKSSPEAVLKPLHKTKDKKIFRILATITNPADSQNARKRALEKLPELTQNISAAASDWVSELVNRCSMGDSLNSQVVHQCIVLARACLEEEDIKSCQQFLKVVGTAAKIFPELCNPTETFELLTEFFSKCRETTSTLRRKLNESGIITMLSSILSSSAATSESVISDNSLTANLIQLCTSEGTPEQARNAVHTLFKMADETTSREKVSTLLLDSLTSASKLSLPKGDADSSRLISIIASLSALSECSPHTMSTPRGARAIKFCLETVVLGRNTGADDSGDSSDDEEIPSTTPGKGNRRSPGRRKHATPQGKGSLLEDSTLSFVCRRICAAIEFLVSYVRSTKIVNKRIRAKRLDAPEVAEPDDRFVSSLFGLFGQIIVDQGLAPSGRDRKTCLDRSDRAALRQCAGVSLLRLSDPRLGYEKDILSPSLWHVLGGVFVDEERAVRNAAMAELTEILSGSGLYGLAKSQLPPQSPSLRLLSYLVFCVDGDRDHDTGNGSAANVGSAAIEQIKRSAYNCVKNMRRASDDLYTKCRAKGPEMEEKFEQVYKMHIMPEYMLPYAYHLLSLRREAPCNESAEQHQSDDDEEETVGNRDSQLRHLTKRLKVALDLLVLSLGDSADNISFLMRITEVLANNYSPVDVSPNRQSDSGLQSKLKTVCDAARESIQSYIKQDVNLAPYVSGLQIPRTIFRSLSIGTVTVPLVSGILSPLEKDLGRKQSRRRRSSRNEQPNTAKEVNSRADFSGDEDLKPRARRLSSQKKPESPKGRRAKQQRSVDESSSDEETALESANKSSLNSVAVRKLSSQKKLVSPKSRRAKRQTSLDESSSDDEPAHEYIKSSPKSQRLMTRASGTATKKYSEPSEDSNSDTDDETNTELSGGDRANKSALKSTKRSARSTGRGKTNNPKHNEEVESSDEGTSVAQSQPNSDHEREEERTTKSLSKRKVLRDQGGTGENSATKTSTVGLPRRRSRRNISSGTQEKEAYDDSASDSSIDGATKNSESRKRPTRSGGKAKSSNSSPSEMDDDSLGDEMNDESALASIASPPNVEARQEEDSLGFSDDEDNKSKSRKLRKVFSPSFGRAHPGKTSHNRSEPTRSAGESAVDHTEDDEPQNNSEESIVSVKNPVASQRQKRATRHKKTEGEERSSGYRAEEAQQEFEGSLNRVSKMNKKARQTVQSMSEDSESENHMPQGESKSVATTKKNGQLIAKSTEEVESFGTDSPPLSPPRTNKQRQRRLLTSERSADEEQQDDDSVRDVAPKFRGKESPAKRPESLSLSQSSMDYPVKASAAVKSPSSSDDENLATDGRVRSLKVHFSPELHVRRSARTTRTSNSPSSALYPESSIGGDTLEATPPEYLPTTTLPDPTSDEASQASTRVSKRSRRNKKANEDSMPGMKSTSQSLQSSVPLSQQSTLTSKSSPRVRKRVKEPKAAKSKKKAKESHPPKHIKVDRSAPQASPLETRRRSKKPKQLPGNGDEFDFDFDDITAEENEPKTLNISPRAMAKKGKRTGKKRSRA